MFFIFPLIDRVFVFGCEHTIDEHDLLSKGPRLQDVKVVVMRGFTQENQLDNYVQRATNVVNPILLNCHYTCLPVFQSFRPR